MVLLDWEVDIADGGVASDFGGSSVLAALRLRFRWRLLGAMRLLDLGRSAGKLHGDADMLMDIETEI